MLNEELKARIQTLRNTMKEQQLDAYLVASEHDIWYYTNITYKPEERPFFLLVDLVSDIPQLLVPKLEESHVKKGVLPFHVISYWDYPATNTTSWHYLLNKVISKYSRVGIESTIPLHFYERIAHSSLVPTNLVELQRKIKSPYEVEKIKECAQFADKGMAAILNSVYYGASVIEPFALSRSIQNELIQLKQFDPLTTSLLTAVWPAPISAMPHSVPQLDDEMKDGPNVAMTYFRINGYAAECERTFFLSEPTAREVELFEQMMEARARALALVRPGAKTADIDAAARDYLESKGLLSTLLHRTGHGVGLGNHEAPFMAIGSDEVLEENMIITIEPGIYIEGEGGYRHSDTILITKDGYELLTKAPLQLHELVLKKSNLLAKVKGKIIKKTLKM